MKRFLSLIMSIVMLLSMMSALNLSVFAAGDSIATATGISTGSYYSGSITETNTKDVYRFTLPSSGRINIKLNAYIYETNYYLYDANGNKIWESRYQYWNSVSEVYSMDNTFDLTKGVYFFAIEQYSGTGSYNFSIGFTSANESFSESNNEIKSASAISLSTTYKGQIAYNDDKDVYRFTLPSSGRLTIKLNANIYETNYFLYDANGNKVWESKYQYWNSVSEVYSMNTNIDLTKGTYYFAIEQYSGTGNYDFKLTFKSANESFAETLYGINNDIKSASAISLSTTYNGQIAYNDNKDVYIFTIPSSGRLTIKLNAYIYETNYFLYDADGNKVWESKYQYWNNVSEVYSMNANVDLTKGTYFFAIEQYSGTGNYDFKLTFKSANESFTKNDNDISSANPIKIGTKYKGQLAENDSKDMYRFELAKDMRISLDIVAYSYCTNFYVYDANGNTIWSKTYQYIDETAGKYSSSNYIDLSEGVYYFAVSEYNGTGNYNFTIKIVPPELKSVSNTTSGVKVKWGKVEGATKYRVYRKKSGGSYAKLADTTSTSYTDKTAKVGTKYYYKVKTISGSIISDASSSKGIIRLVAPKIKAAKNTENGIKITWDKASNAKEYRIYRKTSGGSYVKIADVKSTSYTDNNVYSGTKYYYVIKAKNGSNLSDKSSSKASIFLSDPTLNAIENASSGIKLSWYSVTGASKYRVYRKVKGGSYAKIADVKSTSYTDKTAKSGTKYYYVVKAIKDSYISTSSDYKALYRLSAPTMKTPVSSKSGITVKWEKVNGASGYAIYRKSYDGSYYYIAAVEGGSKVSYLDKSASKGVSYGYKVRAYKGSTYSAYSSAKSITDKY